MNKIRKKKKKEEEIKSKAAGDFAGSSVVRLRTPIAKGSG